MDYFVEMVKDFMTDPGKVEYLTKEVYFVIGSCFGYHIW